MYQVKKGTVYLIGAGPGDPDLITVKGKKILGKCDTVIYDLLAPSELLFSLHPHTEKLYVGKKAGKHTLTQDKINELMVKCAKDGKSVARLKGGDPFLFGRGAEEIQFLKSHQVNYEVIPGITAGLGASAYSGISCTDRNKSSYVIFATGHKATKEAVHVPWDLLAKATNGTIVIYMVVSKLNDLVNQFITNGMPANTPSAILERGTLPTQRIITAPLKDIYKKAKESNIQPPAILIIGQVVKDQKQNYWLKNKPLLGLRILIPENEREMAELPSNLKELGAEVLNYPCHIQEDFLDTKHWNILDRMEKSQEGKINLLFFSNSDIEHFISQGLKQYSDIRFLNRYQIIIEKDSVKKLSEYALQADTIINSWTANNINKLALKSATNILVDSLKDESVYKLIPGKNIHMFVFKNRYLPWPDGLKEKLLDHLPNMILFKNYYAVDFLMKNLEAKDKATIFKDALIISLNHLTSKQLAFHGINNIIQLYNKTSDKMTLQLIKIFKTSLN